MKIETLTLKDLGFKIKENFPQNIKAELLSELEKIDFLFQERNDSKIVEKLKPLGYVSEFENKKECQIFNEKKPKHSVDFYHQGHKIAIEVEKAEVKRILHDVIKLMKAAEHEFIDFGVLIIPKKYQTLKAERVFSETVKNDISFYFNAFFNPQIHKLKDILIMIYINDQNKLKGFFPN